MTRVPILPIPKNYKSQGDLIDHFLQHLSELRRERREAFERGEFDLGKSLDDMTEREKASCGFINDHDISRATRRAKRLFRRLEKATGMRHLTQADRERLLALGPSVPAVTIASEHRADELAAQLEQEMPWMSEANMHVWQDMRRAAARDGIFTVTPLLIDGPPGIGKSSWARQVAKLVGVPSVLLDASKGGAGMELAGLERGYSSSQPGRPVETILHHQIANPIVIVDELCKAAARHNTKSEAPFADTLLSMIEPATSKQWECIYFRMPFDMSHISWIMTSNYRLQVPEALRSRLTTVQATTPGIEHLAQFVRIEGAKRALADPSIDAVIEALRRVDTNGLSLRSVARMLRLAEVIEKRPLLH